MTATKEVCAKMRVRLCFNDEGAERVYDELCKDLVQLEEDRRKFQDGLFVQWARWEYVAVTMLCVPLVFLHPLLTRLLLLPLASALTVLVVALAWAERGYSRLLQRATSLGERFAVFENLVRIEKIETDSE